MMRFAPAWTAFCSTSSVAIEVVTTPVTTVDGSPALNVSTSSLRHSTPMFALMRSTTSWAVTRVATSVRLVAYMNGVTTVPAAVIATKSRLDITFIDEGPSQLPSTDRGVTRLRQVAEDRHEQTHESIPASFQSPGLTPSRTARRSG